MLGKKDTAREVPASTGQSVQGQAVTDLIKEQKLKMAAELTGSRIGTEPKLQVYVNCLNVSDERIKHAIISYRKWAGSGSNLAAKLNGRPSLATFGSFFTDACGRNVREASRKAPATPELDVAATEYADTVEQLLPLIDDAENYYGLQKAYQDDNYARGRDLHTRLTPLFTRFERATLAFNKLVDQGNTAELARERDAIEKREGRKFTWHEMTFMASAKTLLDVVDNQVIAPDAYAQALESLTRQSAEFDGYVRANRDVVESHSRWSWFPDAKNEFVGAARALGRAVKSGKGIEPARQEFFERYNKLVDRDNDLR